MAFPSLSQGTVLKRMKAAMDVEFNLDNMCGAQSRASIDANSQAVGAPHPFIFFPLLTVIAGCMGVKAMIKVNEEWREPAIFWSVVAARKGEKKSPAYKRVTASIRQMEKEMQDALKPQKDKGDISDSEDSSSGSAPLQSSVPSERLPQIMVEFFSFEELYHLMSRSGCQIMAVYDEIMVLYQQLDLYKPNGSKIDKTTLLSLYNGGSWQRNFKNCTSARMDKTAFNYSGFIQPSLLIEMLQQNDVDGFYDRILVSCPPEVCVPFNDLKVPMPQNIVPFYDVFKAIRDFHQQQDEEVEYSFSDDALAKFADMHDELQNMKCETDDDNRRGHFTKAITQLIRVCGILHVMELAFDMIHTSGNLCADAWVTTISTETLDRAWTLVSYGLKQKWALMPPTSQSISIAENFITKNQERIHKFLSQTKTKVTPSEAVQQRLVPIPLDDNTGKAKKANVPTAVAFMQELSSLGFGELVDVQNGKNKRVSKLFRKRKYVELSDAAKDTLKSMRMSRETYDNEGSDDEEEQPSVQAAGLDDQGNKNKASNSNDNGEASTSKDTGEPSCSQD